MRHSRTTISARSCNSGLRDGTTGDTPIRYRRRAPAATLLIVLIIVGAIFIMGLAAITAATRTTRVGENFAAATVAMQAAQNGLVVADRRLVHPWYVGYTIDEPWPGNGGFDVVPLPGDGLGRKYDQYYWIQVVTDDRLYTVTSTGRAVLSGGSVGSADDVVAERTVKAVFERPKIEVPYAILGAGDVLVKSNIYVKGSIFANDDVTVNLGSWVNGTASAVDRVYNYGTVSGGTSQYQDAVELPPILYYGYRPSYDYGGMECTAIQLSGTALATNPPKGMPGNPNNLFYSNQEYFTLMHDVEFDRGTMISMYNVVIQGHVTIKATSGFPAMIISRDLILLEGAHLDTEGLVQVGGKVRGSPAGAPASSAKWHHLGPVVFKGTTSFDSALVSEVTIESRTDLVEIQPIGRMVLPLIKHSYTETP